MVPMTATKGFVDQAKSRRCRLRNGQPPRFVGTEHRRRGSWGILNPRLDRGTPGVQVNIVCFSLILFERCPKCSCQVKVPKVAMQRRLTLVARSSCSAHTSLTGCTSCLELLVGGVCVVAPSQSSAPKPILVRRIALYLWWSLPRAL